MTWVAIIPSQQLNRSSQVTFRHAISLWVCMVCGLTLDHPLISIQSSLTIWLTFCAAFKHCLSWSVKFWRQKAGDFKLKIPTLQTHKFHACKMAVSTYLQYPSNIWWRLLIICKTETSVFFITALVFILYRRYSARCFDLSSVMTRAPACHDYLSPHSVPDLLMWIRAKMLLSCFIAKHSYTSIDHLH